eukprot:4498524-Pyramimonas_sp.AAC.1
MTAVVLRYVLRAAVVAGTQLKRCRFYAQLHCSAEDLRSKRVTVSFLLFPSPALAGGIRGGIDQTCDRAGGKDIHLSLLSSTNGSG